jgi:hypothetical protein
VFAQQAWAKESMAVWVTVAEVVVVIVVNTELKTPTPKAPRRRCTATGVDLPDDTGRFVFLHK